MPNKISKLDHSAKEGHGDESENTVHVSKGTYIQIGTAAPTMSAQTFSPNRKTGLSSGDEK